VRGKEVKGVRQADSDIHFFKAASRAERVAINTFLARHNVRGAGSRTGYLAYYAAAQPADGRSLLDQLVAALKICPLHTPAAARFFAREEWRHVYVIQRLAACRAPDNLLSRFQSWCLKDIGRDEKVWYVAAYADSGTYNPDTGRPNSGAVYRASGGLYAGQTRGGGLEGYLVTRSIVCQVLTRHASNFSLTNYASNLLKLSHRHFQAKRRLLTYIYTEIGQSEAR
jgi:hypothetical protein